jgi:hypothetical protein
MKFANCRLWEALVKTHKHQYILAIVYGRILIGSKSDLQLKFRKNRIKSLWE